MTIICTQKWNKNNENVLKIFNLNVKFYYIVKTDKILILSHYF